MDEREECGEVTGEAMPKGVRMIPAGGFFRRWGSFGVRFHWLETTSGEIPRPS